MAHAPKVTHEWMFKGMWAGGYHRGSSFPALEPDIGVILPTLLQEVNE